jgi:hypothetical protein
MRKIAFVLLIMILVFSGCGETTTNPDPIIDNSNSSTADPSIPKNYLSYEFVIPSDNPTIWPIGIHVPEGYTIEQGGFASSGSLALVKDEGSARFQFSIIVFPGNTNAQMYYEQTIKNDRMKSCSFNLEVFGGPVSAPYPGEEDVTHCEATSASSMFTRIEDEDNSVIGEVHLYWFDVQEAGMTRKSASIGMFMLSEASSSEWSDAKYQLDQIRKSIFLLPSKVEILAKMERADIDTDFVNRIKFARVEIEIKQMQMRNGVMPAPGWQSLFNKKIPAYSDSDNSFYLVEFQDTPSRLLPHPTISGMTVDPKLSEELFQYLKDEEL